LLHKTLAGLACNPARSWRMCHTKTAKYNCA